MRLRDRAIARSLPLMPRRLVRRVSAPYIAGESLEQALPVVQRIHAAGMTTTVDVLGESIVEPAQAIATRDEYLAALGRLAELGEPQLVNVSVKLTALGMAFDEQLARDSTRAIVGRARELSGFVRIDMEDTPYTDATFALHRDLRAEGFDNLGVVVQAYLRRSLDDARELAAQGARVRVVKGIYVEPETLAYRDMRDINASFLQIARVLAEAGCHVAFATHDDALVDGTRELVRELQLPHEQYEYQMLLGVREPLRDELVAQGHALRVYVPYGARWYEYSIRRLRENPRVAGHVARALVTRIFGWLRWPGRQRDAR